MVSLDTFRGFDIGAMLFVNMTWNRDVFHRQLFHVPWDAPQQGATFTDLVFPWFIFIAGAAVPLSIEAGRGKNQTKRAMIAKAARRSVVIYLLGVLLTVASRAYETPLSWMNLLEWNILQLIGAAYFVIVLVWLLPVGWRIGFVVGVLLLKWLLMTILPWELVLDLVGSRASEGAPVGQGTWAHFEAVKRTLNFQFVETEWLKNLGGWLGMSQQYLPLATIGLIGGMTSTMLRKVNSWQGLSRVAFIGMILVALSLVLQGNYQPEGGGLLGDYTVPYSKLFFSPAYCLLSAGTGVLLLSFFYAVSDLASWSTLKPLQFFGLNAIFLYVGAELSFKTIFSKWQMPTPNGESDSLASSFIAWIEYATGSPTIANWSFVLIWLACWWLICWWMYRQKIFLKV